MSRLPSRRVNPLLHQIDRRTLDMFGGNVLHIGPRLKKPRRQGVGRKPNRFTFDLLEPYAIPIGLKKAMAPPPPPPYDGVLWELMEHQDESPTTNLQRFANYTLGIAMGRNRNGGAKSLLDVANAYYRLVSLFYYRHEIDDQYLHALNSGGSHQLATAKHMYLVDQTWQATLEAIHDTYKALARASLAAGWDRALMLEPIHLHLKGNKSTLIELTRKGVYDYDQWTTRYPLFWKISGEGFHQEDNWPYVKVPRPAAYPIWWDLLDSGDFMRFIRYALERNGEEWNKTFASPALVAWDRARNERREELNPIHRRVMRNYKI